MQIRTLIVDDEPLARTRIVNLLKPHDDIYLIGQCRNGQETIEFIEKKRPELIFLDIQMPDMDGFKVISRLNLSYKPMIVFATAYDKYALQAFEVHAIDYLLKPFDQERFDEAVTRAKSMIKLKKSEDFNQRLLGLLDDYRQDDTEYLSAIKLKDGGRLVQVPVDEVYWMETEGNYITLNLETRKFLYRMTMNAMEAKLDPDRFLRIHRSYLVNLTYVRHLKYLQGNEYKFILRNGHELISSRSYKETIVEAFNNTRPS